MSGQITGSLGSLGAAAARQAASVKMIVELERQAAGIGDIVRAAARIADQTNLLALNAAIEAAQKTIGQQTTARAQSETAASELSTLADDLTNASDVGKSAEDVASAAEELSSAIDEIKRAASEIMTALSQINRGAQQQAAASEQSLTAITQIEKGVQISQDRSAKALSVGEETAKVIESSIDNVDALISGVISLLEETNTNREVLTAAEQMAQMLIEAKKGVEELSAAIGG